MDQMTMVRELDEVQLFRPGQAWKAPEGELYRVVGHDGGDLAKPMQAVLRRGAYGDGRARRLDWDATEGWTLVPEAEVHDASTRPPLDFDEERKRVRLYLDREIQYGWIPARERDRIPRDACCIVLCGQTSQQSAYARCLAFVKEKHGNLRWYGVTAAHHEPVALSGVAGFVPVADIAPLLLR